MTILKSISKEEASYIREKNSKIHIHIVSKEKKGKRKRYFVEEGHATEKLLKEYENSLVRKEERN